MPFMDECAAPIPDRPVGNTSGRTVHCVKFQKDLPALDTPPWPGELGQRIYENVSAQAWKMWEDRQKMILNEYRLMPWQKEAQELIARMDQKVRRGFPCVYQDWSEEALSHVWEKLNAGKFDPMTFKEIGHVEVTDQGRPVTDLNELEYIDGQVWANVWHTDRIARISPETGRVVGWIDLRGLMSGGFKLDPEAVLNGIAYDAAGKRLFVTGKMWPRLFEIEVIPRARG